MYYFCSRHGKIVALQVHLLGRLFIDASDLMSDSYFSVSPTLSAFSLLLSYLCLGFAPIFPDICYHLTHYKPAAADIPVASDNPAHYADAIRY
ncbi:hypothetical protein ACVOGE_00975, partial [Shigella sonnei]